MKIVETVLGGKVNNQIVSKINSNGGSAIGLSGADGELLRVKKMKPIRKGVDLGRVGEITKVNTLLIV